MKDELIETIPGSFGRRRRRQRKRLVPGIERLTPRQQEILKLLARGFYYKEIGAALGISHATVRAHLHSVYQRLGVRSRARAAVKFHEYFRNGQPAPSES
jgi:RNA polymerase sigma factor (sigma-70 family)